MDSRWQHIQKDYLIVSRLGKGCYGEVAEAIHIPSGRSVAVKLITDIFTDVYELKKVIREIEILRNFSLMPNGHEFVTTLFDVITPAFTLEQDPHNYYIFLVLDLMPTAFDKVLK